MTSKQIINKYCQYCLSGNIQAGLKLLNKHANHSLLVSKFKKSVEKRFLLPQPQLRLKTQIKWVRDVLKAYSRYYVQVLALQIANKEAELSLAKDISTNIFGKQEVDLDSVEEKLENKFHKIGWHFLGGVTQPFRGPYIYETQQQKEFRIKLPLTTVSLPVYYMSKFHSLSWVDYATLGKMGTGGWAKSDGLYCVIDKYDIKSEYFKINYLKHEAQHHDDYTRFPELKNGQQVILEYRAKLAELIYAESTTSFKKFMIEAQNDSSFPHLQASFRIKEYFMKKLKVKSYILGNFTLNNLADIRKIALECYLENTKELSK